MTERAMKAAREIVETFCAQDTDEHEWDELRALIAAALDAFGHRIKSGEEWRDISTAPSDGRPIWVVGGYRAVAAITGADGEWWRSERARGAQAPPTRWMPVILPSPPQEKPE